MDITSDILRFNNEGEATARGVVGSGARPDHDQALEDVDMAEGMDRSRRSFIKSAPVLAAFPLVGMVRAETKEPTLQEAFRTFERLAIASVPEGYEYAGLCAMGSKIMISAEPTHPGRNAICMWPLRESVWRPITGLEGLVSP